MIPFARMIQYGNAAPAPVRLKYIRSNGTSHFFLYDNGDLYGYGTNSHGNFGLGTSNLSTLTLLNTNVGDVFAGPDGTFLLKNDNTIWFAGNKADYSTTQTDQTTWLDISTIIRNGVTGNIVKICGVNSGSIMLTDSGNFYRLGIGATGSNGTGATDGSGGSTNVPKLVSTGVKDIVGSSICSFYLTNSGNLYATGGNTGGNLGLGTTTNVSSYTLSKTSVSSICVVASNTVAIIKLSTGEIQSTGTVANGILGINTISTGGTNGVWTNINPMQDFNFNSNTYSTGNAISPNAALCMYNGNLYGSGWKLALGQSAIGTINGYTLCTGAPANIIGFCTVNNGSIVWTAAEIYYAGSSTYNPDRTGDTVTFTKLLTVPYYTGG